jgi:subtilisin family serine protease
MQRTGLVVAFAAIGAILLVGAAQARPERSGAHAAKERFIVVLKPSVENEAEVVAEQSALFEIEVSHVYRHALKGYAGELPPGQAKKLADDPRVESVEPDELMSIDATQQNAPWGLDRIDQRPLPLDTTFSYASTGSGVTAYIIDTGIRRSHSDFGGRASSGRDTVDNDNDASDCNGHGTHVAGTVGGSTYGVAKGVSLIGVRVLGCNGSGFTSGVIAGVDWATQHHGSAPAVANMSLGGSPSAALDNAVRNSIADGISYAIAAGNSNKPACNYSPARVAEAMTIGATDQSDRKASFSNRGSCVDWFAPGVGITSAWWTSDTATNTISGTSMATPHTAGVAALYLQANPTASPATVAASLYDSTTKGIVTSARTANNHLLFTNY